MFCYSCGKDVNNKMVGCQCKDPNIAHRGLTPGVGDPNAIGRDPFLGRGDPVAGVHWYGGKGKGKGGKGKGPTPRGGWMQHHAQALHFGARFPGFGRRLND